jgi:hypothetical protein
VEKLADCFALLGVCDDMNRRRHCRDVALQIAASNCVPDLAKLASKPAGPNGGIVGSQDSHIWNGARILRACAEHIRAKDLSSVVVAGLNGGHYRLLSALAQHHNGFNTLFFAAEGPRLMLQRLMTEELQTEVAQFLLSIWEPGHIWEPEQAAWNYQHDAWACFGASIRDMWDNQYRLYNAGDRVIRHLLGTNPWVRKAFVNSRPMDLAKRLLASEPPDWLEHQIRCALPYSTDCVMQGLLAAFTY